MSEHCGMTRRAWPPAAGLRGLMLMIALAAAGGGCMTMKGEMYQQTVKPCADRMEKNVYLQTLPLTDQQKGAQVFARLVTPFELPGLAIIETALAPFALLDYKAPAYPLTTFWWELVTSNDSPIKSPEIMLMGWPAGEVKACLIAAYAGNRVEALRRADRLVKKSSTEYSVRYLAPARVYLMFGETAKARECLRKYADDATSFGLGDLPTITDICTIVPLFGVFPALGGNKAYVVARDISNMGLFTRTVYDQHCLELLDEESVTRIREIDRSFWWQGHTDYGHLEVVAANVDGKPKRALARADEVIRVREKRLAKNRFQDGHDMNAINMGLLLPSMILPSPMYFSAAFSGCYKFPLGDLMWPDKYVLAVCYLEKVRALCRLDRAQQAEAVLPKIDRVVKGRDWSRWVALEAHFLCHLHTGNYAKAHELEKQLIANSLGSAQFRRLIELTTLHGEAFEKRNELEYALSSYRGLIDAIDSIYKQAGEDSAYSEEFNRVYLPFYNRAIALMCKLNRPAEEVLLMADRTKSRILGQMLLSKAYQAEAILAEHRDEYRLLLRKHREMRVRAAAITDPARRGKAQQSAEYLRSKMRKIEALSGEAGGERRGVFAALDRADLRRALAGSTHTLVYWLGHEFSLAFESDASGVLRQKPMPSRGTIRQWVAEYRKALMDPRSDPMVSEAGQRLAQALFPFGAPRGRCLVIPDKELYVLPFEALPVRGSYFVTQCTVHYEPSLSVRLAHLKASRPRAEPSLLALGNPVFGEAGAKESEGFTRSFTRAGVELVPLPGTQQEIDAVSALFSTRTVLSGPEATEAQLRSKALSSYRYVHFATHGLLGEELTGLGEPALALSRPTRKQRKREDGFLTASEISQFVLNADLVTLSACNTARGKLSTGDGVASLATSFLSSGARGVVVSTWSVADVATAVFMEAFYRDLIRGVDSGAALHNAKLALMSGQAAAHTSLRGVGGVSLTPASYKHPFYWAPFVYVGASRGRPD